MTIKYLDSKRISLDTTATHTVNYSTQTGWTASNSRISITSGYAYMNNSGSQLGDYIHTPLGLTLSDTKWYVEFEYYNMGAVNLYPFILAAGTSTIWNSTQDMIGVGEENPNKLRIVSKDGGNSIQQEIAFTPTMSTNTSYYCTLSRNGQVITLKLYTDTARTVQFGSTITQTISGTVTGLTTMQHSGRSDGGGTSGYNFKVKGTKIYDGVTSAPTKPTNVQDNSILVEKDTGKRYWFAENKISTTGLKGYYNFNESSGNLINQSTTGDGLGSSADGTNTSVSYSQTGKIGNAYTYTRGTSKTVLGSSLSQFNFMHNQSQLFSINLWYKLSGSLVNVTGMMGNGQDDTAKIGLSIYAVATGALSINTTNGSGQDALITAGGVIPDNTDWHMLTVTYNRSLASSNWLTYIDGVLVATINKSGSFTPSNSNASHAMELGTYGVLAQSFFGTLDECSIWNRVLTTSEISALYNSGSGSIVSEANNATWTMEPTYDFDFSNSTGWVPVGSNITVTGGVIQASAMVTQSDNRIYYDLGSALSDKFIIDFDHYADSSPSGSYWQMFALTDTTAIPKTDDGIYPLIDMGSWDTYLRYSNEGSETNVGTLGSLTTGQWQYVRFVRDGTTGTLTVYSDSARTTQVLNVSGTIPATVTGLRYFQSGALSGANTGTATYKIDNLKIYNGVTTIN